MQGPADLYHILKKLDIPYEYYEHPPVFTIEETLKYKKHIKTTLCKNIFLRNHKGNRHYLVILRHDHHLPVKDLEQKLRQGKLTFASERRLHKYLGLSPGSVSPFGLIHDIDRHIYLYLDKSLRQAERLSFHPCVNTASLVIGRKDFFRYLDFLGHGCEFIDPTKEETTP